MSEIIYDGEPTPDAKEIVFPSSDEQEITLQLLSDTLYDATVDAPVDADEFFFYQILGGIIRKVTGTNLYLYLKGKFDLIFAPRVSFIVNTNDYTTPNNDTLKQLFNGTANGECAVRENTTYFFECDFVLTNMSTTPGTYSFAIGGSATISNIFYWSESIKPSNLNRQALAIRSAVYVATEYVLVTSGAGTTGIAILRGWFTILR